MTREKFDLEDENQLVAYFDKILKSEDLEDPGCEETAAALF